ncbi:carbonic anhydrase [Aliidongia dinghuensis]|uniref:Carbonic anhydrase n=1 Tax=Aliidongia dinghuensis TaxID=1867774 RepID=A0A8J2YWN8_9PROT|nr:carbonic anhydrase [Aliidongia dinghuensis]GGF31447.1 carbonic anhydrase [Aliidongia dinghuensis]
MERLIEGYRRFRETYWVQNKDVFEALAAGQSPRAMVITCADSRVDPQLIFDAKPGEIFCVRNVAALVPPYKTDSFHHGTSAAIEFAVRSLEVEHVIVLGHAQCGGIRALLAGGDQGDFIGRWMEIAAKAREQALVAAQTSHEGAQHLCERESIKVAVDNLMTFPWVVERVQAGRLKLHGWHFDFELGELERVV